MTPVHLRYFASIRETLGCGSEAWQTSALTVGALRAELLERATPSNVCRPINRCAWR